ncbi:MAG: VWA domain-containing protein [Phycisphaerales bacterium]
MTFLTPIPALVAAAISVPALLALYLLRLRRRPVRVGSILFWPAATEDVQANVPLRWLKPTWLLLLHVAALGLLLAAFARPALHGVSVAGERAVLVLDTSASMNAVDPGESGTRLQRARVRAKELARDLRSAGARSVAVVQLAARARPLTGFTSSQGLLAGAIDAAEATDQPGNLGAALALVDAMAQGGGDEGQAGPPTVFLISDGSFGAMDEVPSTVTGVRFERIGPEVPVEGRARGGVPVDNAGVLRLAARRDDRDATLLRVYGEISATGVGAVDVPVTLAVDGRVMDSRVVKVEKRGAVLFELRGVLEGVLTLSIVRADALAADDAASVVVSPPEQPRILLVQPVAGGAAAAGAAAPTPTWLLGDVLEELHPRQLVRCSPDEYARLVREGADRGYDLLVFDSVGTMGGVPRVPSLCLGAVPPLKGWEVGGGPVAVRANSIFWDRSQAVLQGVPLDSLVVRQAVPVRFDDGVRPAPQVLVRSDDLPLAVMAVEAGVRHVVVSFELRQSNWPLTPSFAVFIANAVDELTLRSRSSEGRSFLTDEPVTMTVPARGAVVLEGPRRVVVREAGEAAGPGPEVVVNAGVLPRAGVYVVRAGEPAGPRAARAVAVNVCNEVESGLASPESVRVAGREVGSVQPTRVPREVWHWFALGALVLLAVEWVVYGLQVRA